MSEPITAPLDFQARVLDELIRARANFPRRFASFHEALAVIEEEVAEFRAWVYRRDVERVPELMLAELVQIAAMAQRAAEDIITRGDGDGHDL